MMDGIKSRDFNKSLNIEHNLHNIFTSGQGAGKSGSFFFFSNDRKFIIKTMRGNEKQVLSRIIDGMIVHFRDTEN